MYRVIQGEVLQGGTRLQYGGKLDISDEEAEHLNAHGELVVSEEAFQRLEKKKALEKEEADEKEATRIAKKRGKPAPAPKADEDDDDEPEETEEPQPAAPAAPKKKRNAGAGK